jgi:glycerol-3-phosphate O-acyltransferase / dihydroxyacetone phosphate acyltransferase
MIFTNRVTFVFERSSAKLDAICDGSNVLALKHKFMIFDFEWDKWNRVVKILSSNRMLYSLFKPLIVLSLRAFFKRIDVIGAENLEHESTLFVCNHPSALFDPIMVASTAKKPIFFLAGAEWFGKGFKAKLFKNQLNMIPVYRPWLAKGSEAEPVSNEDMFRACFDSLAQGKRIIIFPEASSKTVPWIRDIKTGAARIKLGADAKNGANSTKVIPIGLNYSNPNRFQTSVLINVGNPIDFSDITERKNLDERELVVQMTERIHEQMSALVYYPEDAENFEFIKDVKKLLSEVLLEELGIAGGDAAKEFEIRKSIVNRISSIVAENKQETNALAKRLRAYISSFEELGFRRYNPFEESPLEFILKSLGLIVGLPFFLLGSVYNLLPFLLATSFYRKFLSPKVSGEHKDGQINSAFAGSLGFAMGLVVYLIWYVALLVLVSSFVPFWVSLTITMVMGYLSGRFAMLYYKWSVQCAKFIRWHWINWRNPTRIEALLRERGILIQELLTWKD